MDILKIIEKKRNAEELTKEELDFAFNGYLNGTVRDYQLSAILMAICINGMSMRETIDLTDLMIHSGKVIDLSSVDGICVDKHSTGGVGDKTSLIIGPIMAALGLKMGKLSGRGLGYTGGTIDKLESIPGFKTGLTVDEFLTNMNKVGFAECEQTSELTPLDGAVYNLRSSSGTVVSIPLIASSIMSKKIAVGAQYILIDLKVGSGAFNKNKKDAVKLATTMIEIGKAYNKEVIPVMTDMNMPLGDNVGNSLEVLEALDILKGKYGALRDLCVELSSVLYSKAMKINLDEARGKVINVLDNGEAYNKFLEFVKAQGGEIDKIKVGKYLKPVLSDREGILKDISAKKIGYLSLHLGGGRVFKHDKIDYTVGVVLNKHVNDHIKIGDVLCYLYQNDEKDYTSEALEAFGIVK